VLYRLSEDSTQADLLVWPTEALMDPIQHIDVLAIIIPSTMVALSALLAFLGLRENGPARVR
jgi:hypothetical protein